MTRDVSSRTDYLVEGKSASEFKLQDARTLGVTVISEDDVRALLRGEEIAIAQPGEDGSKDLDELIGAARGVFDGVMGARAWEQLIALLDACSLEQEGALTHYISSQVGARWEAEGARDRAIAYWAKEAAAERWTDWLDSEHMPGPAYREIHDWVIVPYSLSYKAPEHWLGEMMRGVDAPKYGIVRSLDLMRFYAASKKVHAILTHPNLDNIHALRASGTNVLTKQNANVVMTHEGFAALRTLYPGNLSVAAARELASHGPRPELRTLDVTGIVHPDQEASALLEPLLDAPLCDHVTYLLMAGYEVPYLLERLEDPTTLPNLERLMYFTPDPRGAWNARRVRTLFERVSELVLDPCYPNPILDLEQWQRFCGTRLPASIQTLDLRSLSFEHVQIIIPEAIDRYVRRSSMLFAPDGTVQDALLPLCRSTLLEHVERVRLGPLFYDERITSIFAEQRPDIELLV